MERLIYCSEASGTDPAAALNDILPVSVRNNRDLAITGALGFSGQHYVQLLEGPAGALDQMMRTLLNDDRHDNLQVLVRAKTPGRLLPSWTMARVDLALFAPKVRGMLAASDGLGLALLLSNLAHRGETTARL